VAWCSDGSTGHGGVCLCCSRLLTRHPLVPTIPYHLEVARDAHQRLINLTGINGIDHELLAPLEETTGPTTHNV
jgi:hypothetical protein